jgi:hypothetical protein
MTMIKTYLLMTKPKGKAYFNLIDYASRICPKFMLVVQPQYSSVSTTREALEHLQVHKITAEERSAWPGTELYVENDIPKFGLPTIYEFSFSEGSAKVLKEKTNRLFGWRQPDLPEDLCFLREDGTPWLTMVSHEETCRLDLTDEEKEELDKALPLISALLKTPAQARGLTEKLEL